MFVRIDKSNKKNDIFFFNLSVHEVRFVEKFIYLRHLTYIDDYY